MNDEIKGIHISFPGQILDYVDTKEHLLDLFNYITNLEQENKKLLKKSYSDDVKITKAKEYINNQICIYYVLDKKLNQLVDKTNIVKEDLLSILNGDEE